MVVAVGCVMPRILFDAQILRPFSLNSIRGQHRREDTHFVPRLRSANETAIL
jgi:hypothetical protein